jgi:hypothetical protein
MTLSLLVQTVRHYQGQQSNLATGAEGSRHFKAPANVRFTPIVESDWHVRFVPKAVIGLLIRSSAGTAD